MFVFGGPEYDILIVGSGPAGMTAAVYACRSGKSVLVVEKEKFGGQITSSPKVENFPGRLEMAPTLETETTALTLASAKIATDTKKFTFSGANLSGDVTIAFESKTNQP